MVVRLWGVRGTLAAPGADFAKFGGNTVCASVECGGRLVVFDAGTGIRALGASLMRDRDRRIELFLTHVHYDHIEGIPFFAPLFRETFEVTVRMGRVDGAASTLEAVRGLMRRPYFPVGPDVFRARMAYREIETGDVIDLGDGLTVTTRPLNHPGGATGYRVDWRGRSFAFVTDTEHVPGRPDENALALIERADVFAYDAAFSDAEMTAFKGYGHSSWEEGLRLRERAQAGRCLAIHHMPFRTDDDLATVDRAMRASHEPSGVAREGDVITLPARVAVAG